MLSSLCLQNTGRTPPQRHITGSGGAARAGPRPSPQALPVTSQPALAMFSFSGVVSSAVPPLAGGLPAELLAKLGGRGRGVAASVQYLTRHTYVLVRLYIAEVKVMTEEISWRSAVLLAVASRSRSRKATQQVFVSRKEAAARALTSVRTRFVPTKGTAFEWAPMYRDATLERGYLPCYY